MAFSYSFFVVLVLLLPGMCFWVGLRAGERSDFLTPAPHKPGSTLTLLIVMLGTIFGHALGAAFFAVVAAWRRYTNLWIDVGYDPNPYRVLLLKSAISRDTPDEALFFWLMGLILIASGTGALAYWKARQDVLKDRIDPVAYGWLNPAVQAVKKGNAFVVAYILTKTSHEGASVAYEGVVQQLALDEDQSIKLVVLNEVDRFLVEITNAGIERLDAETTPITQLQITAAEIANIALEIVRVSDEAVAAIGAEQ